MPTITHSDILRVLCRLVDHLSACADNVMVDGFGNIVQIEITEKQIGILKTLVRTNCRSKHNPILERKTEVLNKSKEPERNEKPFHVLETNQLWVCPIILIVFIKIALFMSCYDFQIEQFECG